MLAFGVLALLSVYKMLHKYIPGEDPSRVYYGTDTMAFNIFLGILLGVMRQKYSFCRVTIFDFLATYLRCTFDVYNFNSLPLCIWNRFPSISRWNVCDQCVVYVIDQFY